MMKLSHGSDVKKRVRKWLEPQILFKGLPPTPRVGTLPPRLYFLKVLHPPISVMDWESSFEHMVLWWTLTQNSTSCQWHALWPLKVLSVNIGFATPDLCLVSLVLQFCCSVKRLMTVLSQRFPKFGLWASSNIIIWKVVRNANFSPSPA